MVYTARRGRVPLCASEESKLRGMYSTAEWEAITSQPVRLGRVPMGPRAQHIFNRGGMDINKRVKLRRTLAELETKRREAGL